MRIAIAAAFVVGCFNPNPTIGADCSESNLCPPGQQCFNGSCLENAPAIDADPSAPDADPDAPDADPNAPDAEPIAPYLARGMLCSASANCPGGGVCVSSETPPPPMGYCSRTDCSAAECDVDFPASAGATCASLPLIGSPGTTAMACQWACLNNTDCPGATACRPSSLCNIPPPPGVPDGGNDAATM